eukprot:GDKI01013484.1.p1 GENE.GDKI01013484.1~~GDKI01013484.1.p1  ORF type:complete len:154 (-),score=31.27 GDKI01013484.1:150-611(-)
MQHCADAEFAGQETTTLLGYCDMMPSPDGRFTQKDREFCMAMNRKMAAMTGVGVKGLSFFDSTKKPGVCTTFMAYCNKYGGAPHCFSGLCDHATHCIDCPHAFVDRNGDGKMVSEVCGGRGVCKVGWKNRDTYGGNGYCVCTPPYRGMACDQK